MPYRYTRRDSAPLLAPCRCPPYSNYYRQFLHHLLLASYELALNYGRKGYDNRNSKFHARVINEFRQVLPVLATIINHLEDYRQMSIQSPPPRDIHQYWSAIIY